MVRALVIIMVATFVLALACFGGVMGLGGSELARNGWVWPETWRNIGVHVNGVDERTHLESSRELAWTGGDTLRVDLPAEVLYVQGADARIQVQGRSGLVERVAIDGDRLYLTDENGPGGGDLTVTITAPSVTRFVINGSPRLTISDFDQDSLTVEVNGSGEVIANGKARSVKIAVTGSGKADLGGVETGDAAVDLAGSGDAILSPTGNTRVAIAGSGDVRLLTRPSSLQKDIGGSGEVHVEGDDGE